MLASPNLINLFLLWKT